jgi:hypothetical protein
VNYGLFSVPLYISRHAFITFPIISFVRAAQYFEFFIPEKNVDSSGVLEESQNQEPVQTELKISQPSMKKADVKPESISQKMTNGNSDGSVNDINKSLDNLHVNDDLPIELKAEVLYTISNLNVRPAFPSLLLHLLYDVYRTFMVFLAPYFSLLYISYLHLFSL